MKQLYCFLLLFVLSLSSLSAAKLHFGAYSVVKLGVNAGEIPDGEKTGVSSTGFPDIGVTLFMPFSKRNDNLGAALDFGITRYAYVWEVTVSEGNSTITSDLVPVYAYLTASPYVVLGGFTLGLNIGLVPIAAGITDFRNFADIDTDQLDSPLLEVRLGGLIPLSGKRRSSQLNLVINAGYSLNSLYKNEAFDHKPASLGVGLLYFFDI